MIKIIRREGRKRRRTADESRLDGIRDGGQQRATIVCIIIFINLRSMRDNYGGCAFFYTLFILYFLMTHPVGGTRRVLLPGPAVQHVHSYLKLLPPAIYTGTRVQISCMDYGDTESNFNFDKYQ